MRVANLNMKDPNEHCPPGLIRETANSKTFCRKSGLGCSSIVIPVNGVRYSKVCGKVIGYQYYQMNGFGPYYGNSHTIDEDLLSQQRSGELTILYSVEGHRMMEL